MHLGTLSVFAFRCKHIVCLSFSEIKASFGGNVTQCGFCIELYPLSIQKAIWLFIILQTESTVLFLGVPFNVRMMEGKALSILIKLTL